MVYRRNCWIPAPNHIAPNRNPTPPTISEMISAPLRNSQAPNSGGSRHDERTDHQRGHALMQEKGAHTGQCQAHGHGRAGETGELARQWERLT